MHIHILETGEPPAPLNQQFGGYPAMFERILAPFHSKFSFSTTAVHKGAALPPLSEFDGFLITGAPVGVYENHDWIAPLEEFIRRAASTRKPVVGICFGHQLMAQAFGGKVEKSAHGWGVGVHHYDVTARAPWMAPASAKISCAVSHQDQVIEPPEGARILGGSDFCPNGVLEYAQGPAVSLQPHPEFTHDYAAALLRLRKDRMPAERFDDGRASLKAGSERNLIAQWIGNFFIQSVPHHLRR